MNMDMDTYMDTDTDMKMGMDIYMKMNMDFGGDVKEKDKQYMQT
jgi:hypothetical protein